MQNLHSVLAMSKGRKRTILLAVGLLAGGLIWATVANREPRYGGHPLSYWLDAYDRSAKTLAQIGFDPSDPKLRQLENQRDNATDAIRQIGTNAIPCLLRWLPHTPSYLSLRYRQAIEHLQQTRLGRWIPDFCYPRSGYARANVAVIGFKLLRVDAKSAIPALACLANDPRNRDPAYAIDALRVIGHDSLPVFVAALANTNAQWREIAAAAIQDFGTNAAPALPVLLQCLHDQDKGVAVHAANTLAKLGYRTEDVMSALPSAPRQAPEAPNPSRPIAPEALTNTPSQ